MCIVIGLGTVSYASDDDVTAEKNAVPTASMVSVPAWRQADRVAIITVEGAIDLVTSKSVRRRIQEAEAAGFDAIVLEVNSPGGELGMVLEISDMLKSSSITNTVAWVRPQAFSGGAIIALACNEIVTSDPASMGDALVIQYNMLGLEGIQTLSPEERTKFLPPLMADVTDSARRNGFDEYLVQAIVTDGIELWMVENPESGERLAINEEEYRLLFGDEVVRGKSMLAGVTGGVQTYFDQNAAIEEGVDVDDQLESEEVTDEAVMEVSGNQEVEPDEELRVDPNAFQPASPTLWDVEAAMAVRDDSETEQVVGLEYPSNRHVFSAGDRGKFVLVGYITDGTSAIVMRDDQMQYFGFSTGIIQNDEELKAFFGADELVRVRINVVEKIVRFMTNPFVKFFLVAVFLIAMFVELIMAGTGIAGAIAIGALVLLIGPGAMIGLSGWWELIAILVGIACLVIEAFVIPGFGIFGVIGFVAIFGGLLGTFVGAGGSMSNPNTQQDLMNGAVTIVLAFITAGIGWWLIVRNAQNLPIFEKLMLSGASGVGGIPQKSMLHAIVPDDGSVRVGSIGVTTTPLLPIGQADFDDRIVDVYAGFGTIDVGTRVRVVSASAMRIEVEAYSGPDGVDDTDSENA
tara:strand:- start:42751 stop:44643 length:1893 start_codon:yes stop_codon:yes gene_type:complete